MFCRVIDDGRREVLVNFDHVREIKPRSGPSDGAVITFAEKSGYGGVDSLTTITSYAWLVAMLEGKQK